MTAPIAPSLRPVRAADVAALVDEVNARLLELREFLGALPRVFVRAPFRYRNGNSVGVEVGVTRPPAAVVVIRVMQADAPVTCPTASAVPAWTWQQETGTVLLTNIGGLTTGTDYLVTLLVVEG